MTWSSRLIPAAISLFVCVPLSAATTNTPEASCAQAASVRSFDLTERMGPVRDQDSSGWCVPFGLSDQLNHWMLTHGSTRISVASRASMVSAAALAFDVHGRERRQAFNTWSRELASGRPIADDRVFPMPRFSAVQATLNHALRSGVCTEADVSSEGFDESVGTTLDQVLHRNVFTAYLSNPTNETVCTTAERSVRAVFPNVTENIRAILNAYRQADPIAEFMRSCRRERVPGRPRVVTANNNLFGRAFDPRGMDQIDALLDRSSTEPVGFYHTGDVYFKSRDQRGPNPPEVDHYALIVGRRYNCATHEVEYIVRNSWGHACESVRGRYRSVPENSDRLAAINSRAERCTERCATTALACRESCSDERASASIALNRPPYTCLNGNFIMRRSALVGMVSHAFQLQ